MILVAVHAGAAFPLSGAEAASSPTGEARTQSLAALEKRKTEFVEAVRGFVTATEVVLPEDGNRLWQRLGAMRRALATWDEAIRDLEGSPSNDAERHVTLGRAYLVRGRLGDALSELLAAERLEPHRVEIQTLLGEAYRRAGKIETAVEAFRQASTLDTKDPFSSYWLGQVLTRLGQAERARQTWRQFHDRRLELVRRDAVESRLTTSFAMAESPHQILDRPSPLRLFFLRAPYRQAVALLRQDRYDEAVRAFAEAASKDPVATAAYLHRSGVGDDTDKLARVLDDARRAVQSEPQDARHHLRLGETLLAMGQREEARRSFEKALDLDPRLGAVRVQLGSLALQAGKLDLARDHLEQAVQQRPDHVEARKLLGAVLAAEGRPEQAIEHYRAAIRLRLDDEQARMALAGTLIVVRRYADAEQELLAAVQDLPESAQARFNLGRFYQMRGRHAEAVRAFEEAAAAYPSFRRASLYARIAGIYDAQLKIDEAVAAYGQALEANPNDLSSHWALAQLFLRRNLYDEALAALTAVLVLSPQHVDAYTVIAQTYVRMGRPADAVEAAQRALQVRPEHRDARYALAQALLRLGRIEEGRMELKNFQEGQARSLADDHRVREFQALKQEAAASLASGDHDKAVALYRRLVEQQPYFGHWHLRLGRALFKAGRYHEALQSLEKARELNVGSLELQRDFAEVYRALGRMEDSERAHAAYLREQEERRRKAFENASR